MRTLDQIIASQRTVAELERLMRERAEQERAIPASPDAPGEEAAYRRDR